MTDDDWMRQAACARHPDLPWTTDTDDLHRVPEVVVRVMLDTCAACPVRAECEAYARDTCVTGGWWAGIDRDPFARMWARVEWEPVRDRSGREVAAQGVLPYPATDWLAA